MLQTADNKREEDAPHFYISWSLHCFRSMTRRCATLIASESNDFFLHHVSRNCPLEFTKGIRVMKKVLQVFVAAVSIFASMIPLHAQWVQTNAGLTNVYARTLGISDSTVVVGTDGGGLFVSTNSGNTWVHNVLAQSYITAITDSGSALFAGGDYGEVYRSLDNGASWTEIGNYLSTSTVEIRSIVFKSPYLFVATFGSGAFRFNDKDSVWSSINSGMPLLYLEALAISDTNVFAGGVTGLGSETITPAGGVCRSADNGVTWTQVNGGLGTPVVQCLFSCDTILFAGTFNDGIFRSTDDGTSWIQVNSGLTSLNVKTIVGRNSYLFAATVGGGVFLSSNNGSSWIAINTGLVSNNDIWDLALNDTYVFAASLGEGVWRRPLSELATDLVNHHGDVLARYWLGQNFPNPFNPSTMINYELPTNTWVSIRVFDMLGRAVKTLVNERQSAGNHSVAFNASKLPSGVYFYRLQAGTYHNNKKLLLLK